MLVLHYLEGKKNNFLPPQTLEPNMASISIPPSTPFQPLLRPAPPLSLPDVIAAELSALALALEVVPAIHPARSKLAGPPPETALRLAAVSGPPRDCFSNSSRISGSTVFARGG